ncbi:MAG: sodium:solute symporter family protein [Hyphomicrobiales bacterium]
MTLQLTDWIVIIIYFLLSLWVGYLGTKKAGGSTENFFLSGRRMPWWLLGISMVATTFSCDTPNLVTNMVRVDGVAANWQWWAFLLTGMMTVFIYAKLWNRSKSLTDLEFYELRYSGKAASFLRGFRALYLGAFFNIVIIASVSLAMIKIGAVMMDWSPAKTLIIVSVIVLFYSVAGGLTSILLTDFLQFFIAMIGAIGAAYFVVTSPEVGGLHKLMNAPSVKPILDIVPKVSNLDVFLTIFLIPLAVQWWSVWYPGAEPGGGGYIAQRMLAAKNEKNAMGATLLFNFLHYAIRPWAWILVALASIVVFPDIASLKASFPGVDQNVIANDFAYPAMLSKFLPVGFLGLVVASLIAAYMSTVSSQINWGASYIVNDWYARFVNRKASEKKKVLVGRIATLLLVVVSILIALVLTSALQAFQILLQIGAGTGLIYIVRWFWWRINAYTEIAGMVISFVIAIVLAILKNYGILELKPYYEILLGVGITTIGWLIVTFVTPPTDKERLRSFYKKIRPGGPGWKKVVDEASSEGIELVKEKDLAYDVPTGILCMILGCISIYSCLFGIGYIFYAKWPFAIGYFVVSAISGIFLFKYMKKLKMN